MMRDLHSTSFGTDHAAVGTSASTVMIETTGSYFGTAPITGSGVFLAASGFAGETVSQI